MTRNDLLEAMGNLATDAEAAAMLDILRERGITDLSEIGDDELFTLIPAAIERSRNE